MTEIKIINKGEELEELDIEFLYKILDGNRTRIRTLSGLLLNISGFILSTSFLTLFFVLKDDVGKIPRSVIILLLLATLSLIVSILFNIFSAMMSQPVNARNKAELINIISNFYSKEYKRISIAIIFLIVALTLFTAGLVILAFAVLN